MFLIKALLEEKLVNTLRILFTLPKHYYTKGNKFRKLSIGAYDPIPLPFKPSLTPISNPRRIAIILLGHEGERILCGWRELDPEKTLLITPQSEDRELMKGCESANKFLLNWARSNDPKFKEIKCHRLDIQKAKNEIVSFCEFERNKGEVTFSIISGGPKPIVVGIVLAALSLENMAFDLMYPVPTSYNSNYTDGVAEMYTYTILNKEKVIRTGGKRDSGQLTSIPL